MMDFIFWVIMALTWVWYMWDGGTESIEEWVWYRQARKEIRQMEEFNG